VNLAPDQQQGALAYYAWKCAQLETSCAGLQRIVDQQRQQIEKLTPKPASAKAATGKTAAD
jgi:hypothetical protein